MYKNYIPFYLKKAINNSILSSTYDIEMYNLIIKMMSEGKELFEVSQIFNLHLDIIKKIEVDYYGGKA